MNHPPNSQTSGPFFAHTATAFGSGSEAFVRGAEFRRSRGPRHSRWLRFSDRLDGGNMISEQNRRLCILLAVGLASYGVGGCSSSPEDSTGTGGAGPGGSSAGSGGPAGTSGSPGAGGSTGTAGSTVPGAGGSVGAAGSG